MKNAPTGTTSEAIPEDERELRLIWQDLSPASRAKLLAYARQLLADQSLAEEVAR